MVISGFYNHYIGLLMRQLVFIPYDSGGLDFRRVGTVRQNVILHHRLLRTTFHKQILAKPGTNTNLAEVKTGNKLDETMLLCYTKL